MSSSEYKARALYDFVAEGPNELSFKANDILTITSNTAGHGWWYAKNSFGQVGVIPENYVQAQVDPPEPDEPPPPFSTFSHSNNNYPSLDAFNGGSNTSKSTYPPPYDQHQYMNPATYTNNWQAPESPAWPSSPPASNLLREQTCNNSIELLKPSATIGINPRTTPTNSDDEYITVTDISSNLDSTPLTNSHVSSERKSSSDQVHDWYAVLPETPAPGQQPLVNQWFDFGTFPTSQRKQSTSYSVPTPSQQQASTYAPVVDAPTASSIPTLVSSSTDTLGSTSMKLKDARSMSDDFSTTYKKKTTKSIIQFLTLSRKPKSTKEKHLSSEETARQSGRKESDSDDSFSDSEYPASSSNATNMHTRPKQSPVNLSNTLTTGSTMGQHGRASMASAEVNKGPPRARFFDKHGMDSYLLNGVKTKSDEHVEITYDEREGGVCWSQNPGLPPFSCKVEEPSKGTKLAGLKAFMEYKIHPQSPGSHPVGRRYKQFDWLHEQLVNKFRFICIPPLPGKQIAGRFEQDFIEERRRQLELWLNRICRHPVLCASYPVQHFLTCDSSDKNKKDWKSGKRKIEKDEFRDAPWLCCVVVKDQRGTESIETYINAFAQQQPGLETQMKNLSQGLAKYIERHTEVYERDIQKISELFSRVHHAVLVDKATPGNNDLSNSIQKISTSYGGIAELYKMKGSEGLRDFNERIQEYIGLLGCFPSVLSMQRSAVEFMKTVQSRGGADLVQVADRYQTLNHVVLAEINFFQKEKVKDLNAYLKTVMDEQIKFYENIAAELREASATFK